MNDDVILDKIPDVRDGLTRQERIILSVLQRTQKERQNKNVPTLMLYGRVLEHTDMGQDEFQRILQRLLGK